MFVMYAICAEDENSVRMCRETLFKSVHLETADLATGKHYPQSKEGSAAGAEDRPGPGA